MLSSEYRRFSFRIPSGPKRSLSKPQQQKYIRCHNFNSLTITVREIQPGGRRMDSEVLVIEGSFLPFRYEPFNEISSAIIVFSYKMLESENDPPPPPKQVRVYQPTYQLDSRNRFNIEKIQKILAQILDTELEEVEYNEKMVPELCVTLAESIRNAVKEENYDRYRIIVNVTISQRRQQSLVATHSFLWDSERDNFVAREFHNPHIHAFAVVYGVYFD